MTTCERCGNWERGDTREDFWVIETPNLIRTLCLKCAIEIEDDIMSIIDTQSDKTKSENKPNEN